MMSRMSMNSRRLGTVLMVALALALVIQPCHLGGHYDPGAPHALACAMALPERVLVPLFMTLFLLAILLAVTIPQAPAFSLLKPPRRAPAPVTAG